MRGGLALAAALWMLTVGWACLSGCGYTTAELYREDVRSVGLPIFENRTFERGLEADLAEALAKELQRRTPYALASGGEAVGGGDTELVGVITALRRQRLARTADTGLPQEVEVRVVIDVQWRDRRSGDVLMERRGLEEVGRFIPAGNVSAGVDGGGVLGEPFVVAQHAAVTRLAQAVVDAMRSDF
ncbi:MAG: LPS assembly lipoprotein LptE [Planctomycetota bacterium]